MTFIVETYSFQWDAGNSEKNLKKHGISDEECEEAFFDSYKKILRDIVHSGKEGRYIILGKTKRDTILFVVFTLRRHVIRIISARPLNRKEYHLYEKKD